MHERLHFSRFRLSIPATGPEPAVRVMRLLVIEDNPRLLDSLVDYLEDEGYAVDRAMDGEEGLYKARGWDYDLVILDVMLPLMDGWTVLAQLRKSKTTPVIMLTARDDVQDRIKGLDCGADDYLPKPFAMAELMARIRAAIRRSAGNPSPRLEFGDIAVDTSAQQFYLRGGAVELTAREYAVMKALVDHNGRVVTREFLSDRIFDEHDDSLSNMLEVYIYKLRSKFGKARIRTKRGVGYSFHPDVP